MITLAWIRFEWDLTSISSGGVRAPSPFVIGRAEGNDLDTVRKVATNAFGMDTGWSDIQKAFAATIAKSVGTGFSKDPPDCVIVRHGRRIIAASVVNSGPGAENHLTTGPCVLHEYRGRGIGTLLLEASLSSLRSAGLQNAYGLTRDKTVAARFLYPKFGGFRGHWAPDFEVAQKLAA
jgi:GNAT superfamily N-acetyltransferase